MANSYSKFEVIRVSPTLDTSAISADNVVFFNSTAIPNAVLGKGGCSKLVGLSILNEDDVAHDFDIIFMQTSQDLGTINDVVGSNSKWTNALAKSAGVLGIIRVDWSDNNTDLINNLVFTARTGDAAGNGEGLPMLLQAAAGSTSVYFAAVSRDGNTQSITTAADDYEFIFHIEKT